MAVFKCLVGLSDGMVITCDGIAHAGKLWLVPRWLEHPTQPIAMPERIIRFDDRPYTRASDEGIEYEGVQLPIPESSLLGQMPLGIEYVDRPPNLSVPIHELRKQ